MMSLSLFQNTLIIRRTRVAIFADIIKTVTIFLKAIIKNLRKVKRNRNYVSKSNLHLYFLMWQNLLIFGGKMLVSAELKVCIM